MTGALPVDPAGLDAAMAGGRPVLVDFWAPWCGPCRALAHILDEIADIYGERLQVVKVDIDQHPDLAQRFGVRAIPVLLLADQGEERARLNGGATKTRLAVFIDGHLR